MARKLAAAHGLGDGDVIVDRVALEELQDAVYCLQAAIEDVERDLRAASTKGDLQDAVRWLLENSRPVVDTRLEPRTG